MGIEKREERGVNGGRWQEIERETYLRDNFV